MAHDHAHHHGDANSYYMEQLFTIAVCGAIGGVMVMMCIALGDSQKRVTFLFGDNPTQHMRVLLGGIGLLALALVRGIYVWFAVGAKPAATHDHDHAHDACGHSHGTCDHDHHDHHEHHHDEHDHGVKVATAPAVTSLPLASVGHSHDHDHDHDHAHNHSHGHDHDHDHGWAPWRFMLLLLPVILFFLGLPNKSILGREVQLSAEDQARLDRMGNGGGKGNEVWPLTFLDLDKASRSALDRDDLEGKLIRVEGQYTGSDPTHFTLQRYRINCCAADALQLSAVITINPADQKKYKVDPAAYQGKWVTVTGRVYVFPQPKGDYLAVVILYPSDANPVSKIVEIQDKPPANPYVS